jgi:hypothetical protein
VDDIGEILYALPNSMFRRAGIHDLAGLPTAEDMA